MDPKDQLINNKAGSNPGQTLENSEQQQPKTSTWTLDEVDAKISKVRAKYENDIKSNYVPKTEYEALNERLTQLENSQRESIVKKAFLDKGGNPESFNDFYRTSDIDFSKDVATQIDSLTKTKSYFFGKAFTPFEAFTHTDGTQYKDEVGFDTKGWDPIKK